MPDTNSILLKNEKEENDKIVSHEQKKKVEDDQTPDVPTIFAKWKKQEELATSYTRARFKRIWVQKSNLPIYQPSTIVDIKPTPDGYISHLTKTNIEALRVKKGQVLMTCSGTIGKVSYVSETLDNKIFSHDLLRIDCKNTVDQGYIYAYLKSKIGNKILLTNSYGAVITHIEHYAACVHIRASIVIVLLFFRHGHRGPREFPAKIHNFPDCRFTA